MNTDCLASDSDYKLFLELCQQEETPETPESTAKYRQQSQEKQKPS